MAFSTAERWWGIFALVAVGFAQLFRSDIEVVIGALYLAAAAGWALGHRSGSIYWLGVAEFFVGVVLFSRGVAGLGFVGDTWHGSVIIVATWCSIGAMFMRFGYRAMTGAGVVVRPKKG